jgi:hypothetical protein
MRYTGEEHEEEMKEAQEHVKGLWGKVKDTLSSDHEPKDKKK